MRVKYAKKRVVLCTNKEWCIYHFIILSNLVISNKRLRSQIWRTIKMYGAFLMYELMLSSNVWFYWKWEHSRCTLIILLAWWTRSIAEFILWKIENRCTFITIDFPYISLEVALVYHNLDMVRTAILKPTNIFEVLSCITSKYTLFNMEHAVIFSRILNMTLFCLSKVHTFFLSHHFLYRATKR